MTSMDENAMFKALLKNRPPETAKISEKTEPTVRKDDMAANAPVKAVSGEDAMYKVLLKNRPPEQRTQFAKKAEVPVKTVPEASVIDYEDEKQVVRTITPSVQTLQTDQIVESIKNLTASVNMMHSLMKSVIVPVTILILIVGMAVLIKL